MDKLHPSELIQSAILAYLEDLRPQQAVTEVIRNHINYNYGTACGRIEFRDILDYMVERKRLTMSKVGNGYLWRLHG